jgi:melanocortin 2 receptor
MLISNSHLLALAINHWIGIIRPLHYAATMTRRTAWLVILGSWICPILLMFAYFSSRSGVGFLSEGCQNWEFLQLRTFRAIFASLFFVPLLLMILIYFHIFTIVRANQSNRIRYQVIPILTSLIFEKMFLRLPALP